MRPRLGKGVSPLCAALVAVPLCAQAPQKEDQLFKDLLELLNTPITTATKSAVKLSDVPAAVTVITRQDIKRYGYQSLDQALARVPEVYTHYEGHDTDADFRGFFANNVHRRVLYLLNGHRINDRFHFGDFLPDTIQDLSNVERIEVIRGPGAALYGSVAMLGVVNIITKDALSAPTNQGVSGSVSAADMASGSLTKKLQVTYHRRWSDQVGLTLDLNWFDGELRYDTQTLEKNRPWAGLGDPGIGKLKRTTDAYFNVPGSFAGGTNFEKGSTMPNFHVVLQAHNFTFGAFLQTHRATWIWPNNSMTFNSPDNDRSWGTGGLFAEWKPEFAKAWDLLCKLSYNTNTNREMSDFSATQFLKDAAGNPTTTSLFMSRIAGVANGSAFIDAAGTNYRGGSGIDATLLTDAAALAHGGGGRTNYAGIDKSVGFEFQLTPYKRDTLMISVGGNYEKADYVNKQWLSMRDTTFIGWSNFGGIKDEGYYYGIWTQAIWNPATDLTITAGARYDRQVVQDAYRELGGDKILWRTVPGSPGVYEQIRVQDRASKDFTPRVALNWRIDHRSNLRVIYAQAFRAVPPQEIIRLPRDFGDAESEKVKDYEALYSTTFSNGLNLSLNAFRMEGNVVYAFSPATNSFNRGSGWSNTGATAELRYVTPSLEVWANGTFSSLKRATDAFGFMKDYRTAGTPALPNMEKALDSPSTLAKAGASYRFESGTVLSGELIYNGSITSLRPVNLNPGDPQPTDPGQPNFLEHHVPSSVVANVTLRQDMGHFGWNGGFLLLKISNLLDSKAWGVLNMDMQNWNANTYAKPTQLPGFGRLITLQVGWSF